MERQASRMDVVFQMVYYNPMSTKCIKVSSFVFSGLFGFEKCVCDPCCFKFVENGILIGLVGGHVDDFLFCGLSGCKTWDGCARRFRSDSSGELGKRIISFSAEWRFQGCHVGGFL